MEQMSFFIEMEDAASEHPSLPVPNWSAEDTEYFGECSFCGEEGEMFMAKWCDQCAWNGTDGNACGILMGTMAFEVEDEHYPSEWCHDDEGQPICTGFATQDELDRQEA